MTMSALVHSVSLRAAALALAGAACLLAGGADRLQAKFDGRELAIGNAHVERKWRVTNGLLYATSFRDLDSGTEWLSRPSAQPAPYPAAALPEEHREVTFKQKKGKFGSVEAESLVVELTATGASTLNYRLQIFPASRGVSVQLTVPENAAAKPSGLSEPGPGGASGIEVDKPKESRDAKVLMDALETFDLSPPHLRVTQVQLLDQTDIHNELVFENEWLLQNNERIKLPGNLFIVENTITRGGLIFLKEAPLPHARPVQNETDFACDPDPRRCRLLGNGTGSTGGAGYRFIVLAYSGGKTGRIEALQTYQRQLRTYDPNRDAMLLSNTWGDRSRDARINAAFMTEEVQAGARLGVDVIQIDDGWQHGRTANSASGKGVWNGFWAADPNFWGVNETRFPNGLAPIVKLAAGHNMRFGLWFAPDSSNNFANWEKDAAKLLEMHRTQGVNYFKIDGVKALSKTSERNLRRFFDRVMEGSRGAVTFDLDVTAEIRPGYFGAINVGPLFVENRYTDWKRYYPHQTLRNLWKLAHYVDPLRLRMEFLNNTRNEQLYAGDPLRPSLYSPAYLFATVMFANPLGWFETSNLPPAYLQELPPLVARWKQERARMFAGTMIPIGSAPDGVSWTGFVSVPADRKSGYALVFREASEQAEWECAVPLFANAGAYRATVLGGSGTASLASGKLSVKIPGSLQFVWVKLEAGN